MSRPFPIGEHFAWRHDEGHRAGVFHTFDALDTGDPRQLRPRKVHVLVPRGAPPPGGFPLLVVHDGDTAFWPGGVVGATWDLASVLSRSAAPPRIVVAVHPVARDREYTHVDWLPGLPWGGLPGYAAWLAETLVPWVRRHWPVDARPAATGVLGSSHGGLAAFWAATRHPDVFGEAVCLSSSFFSGLDDLRTGVVSSVPLSASALVRDAAPVLADPARRPRLWLDWGLRRDGGDHNAVVEHLATVRGREMAALLALRFGYVEGVDLRAVEHRDGGHDEASWALRVGWWLDRGALRPEGP